MAWNLACALGQDGASVRLPFRRRRKGKNEEAPAGGHALERLRQFEQERGLEPGREPPESEREPERPDEPNEEGARES